jgi:hypothetical protein
MLRTACAILLMLSWFCLAGCDHNLPSTTQKLPHYPGAVGWMEREPDSEQRLLNIYNTASFTTTDDSGSVLKFYRDALTGDGWEVDSFQPDPNGLTFKWTSYEQPPATYLCIVTTEQGEQGTRVQVELRYNPGS